LLGVAIQGNLLFSQIQIGSDIDGEHAGDESGHSVSISSAGDRVAVGARLNDDNGNNSGHIRVFELNSGNWVQLGNDINGEAAGDEVGQSVAISSNGNRVL